MTSYYVRPKTYRGESGWHVGSRGGDGGWPISIFTPDRAKAEQIRRAYRDCERGVITAKARDAIVDDALRTR